MIPYRGDISKQDAELLARYAAGALRILEFGPGASTQVMVWAAQIGTRVVSVETDPWWVKKTKANLTDLGLTLPVEFIMYGAPITGEFDLIFVDGADDKRQEFALATWPRLRVGGHMLFHDTRRGNDLTHALQMALSYLGEVRQITINESASNITVLEKQTRLDYVNWNVVEGRSSV